MFVKHIITLNLSIYKLFDTEMSFQGCENREKLLAISFLVCFYFLREQRAMEELLYLSKLVRSFLAILFSQLLSVTLMYTLTSPGNARLDFFHFFFPGCAFPFSFKAHFINCTVFFQGQYHTCNVNVQNVYAIPQFHGGMFQHMFSVVQYISVSSYPSN